MTGETRSPPEAENPSERMKRRFSSVQFLLAMLLWVGATPFFPEREPESILQAVLLTLVMLSAIIALGSDRRKLLVAVALAVPPLLGKWANLIQPETCPPELFLLPALLFCLHVVVNIFRFVITNPRVDLDVLCAAVANYLLLGLLWTFAYLLVDHLLPGSFVFSAEPVSARPMDGFSAFYFSMVTLNTLGYGDIVAVSRVARMLSVVEASTGLFYMTVLIARLVAIHTSDRPPKPGD